MNIGLAEPSADRAWGAGPAGLGVLLGRVQAWSGASALAMHWLRLRDGSLARGARGSADREAITE
jgi:hypothetical protein